MKKVILEKSTNAGEVLHRKDSKEKINLDDAHQ